MELRSISTARISPWPGVVALVLALTLAGCQAGKTPAQPQPPNSAAPAAAKLTWNGHYSEHIQPIFDQDCVGCHGEERAENGLKLSSYEGVMKGTKYGAVVVPGSSSGSTLLAVVKGTADPSIRMPHGTRRLSDQELQNITLWVEAGAPAN